MRPSTLGVIPIRHNILETAWTRGTHTLVVDADRCNVQAAWSRCLNSVHVRIFLAEQTFALLDRVSPFTPLIVESLENFTEAIGVAARQDDIRPAIVGDIGVQILPGELLEEAIQRWVALRSAILKRAEEINLLRKVAGRSFLGNDEARRGQAIGKRSRGQLRGTRIDGLVWCRSPSIWERCLCFEIVVGEVVGVW